MQRCFYAAAVILLGLVTAQVIATVHVYQSNAALYHTLLIIKDAGYLIVPNRHIMPSLREFGPALFGGLFFTLSTGAGLSVLSLSAAWVWHRLIRRKKIFLILFLALWIGSILLVNLRGLCPMGSLYFLVIPPLVFLFTLRWLPGQAGERRWLNRLIIFIPFFLLAILWTSQMDTRLFLDLRDHLLLSGPAGTKINDFYYDYTFYPAEIFKPLHQKLLKTANLEDVQKKPVARALERALIKHDYLNVGSKDAVDLRIKGSDHELALEHKGRTVMQTTLREFLSSSAPVLEEFSLKCDRYAFFRHFTFYSLLIGLPITLYLFLYALFCFISCFFMDLRISRALASILCLSIGLTLLLLFQNQRGKEVEAKNVAEALESTNWHKRIAALRTIERKRLEIGDLSAYQELLKSPYISERYWLARTLGVSRRPYTYEDLLGFLEDTHPNVVSMAFYALGRRGDARAVQEILQRLKTSDHWYNQWHAYRALRMLGWKQEKSE